MNLARTRLAPRISLALALCPGVLAACSSRSDAPAGSAGASALAGGGSTAAGSSGAGSAGLGSGGSPVSQGGSTSGSGGGASAGAPAAGSSGSPPAFDSAYLSELRRRAELGMAPLATWYDVPSGLFDKNAWWTGANMLEVTIDYARETGDAKYISLIDNSFTKNQAGNFLNDYYDDEGWWALTWIKAYDLSHQQKYLDMAKTIFHDMTLGWDDKCGGGVYWRKMRDNKNAIPNELFLTIAARLHLRTPGDAGAAATSTGRSASGPGSRALA